MRVRIMFTIMTALAWAFAPAFTPAMAAENTWDQISKTGVYRIGVMPGRAPYMWQEKGSTEWNGFSIEMGRNVVKALENPNALGRSVKIEYVPTTWATVVLDIQANRMDGFFGMSITEKRKKAISMYGPLYALAHVYINAKGFNPGKTWDSYSDPKIKVAVNMGTTDEDAIRKLSPKATVLAMKNSPESILAVQAGRAHALGTSVLAGLNAIKKNPDFASPMVIPTPIQSLPSGGGTRRDGDGRFYTFMQGWAWASRNSGQAKKFILESIAKAGLDPKAVPPEMKF